ncbi:ABC transporter ATP-binding protein [Halorarius litoreus]|uniref:ABC transporter ATP-binding protein n=1 Tax=Halorarius litoreus TaxID=2962676 RepID=UPI0020CEC15A|nr:ABC transporter ATP-binding protein [Halorarius litoreus]
MSDTASTAETEPQTIDEAGVYGPDDGILVVDNLVKRFGGLVAVDGLSFAIQEQEIVGFIGPNGAGKSTTFNCITGIYPVTSGTIWYKGEDITDAKLHHLIDRGLARTFQSFRPLNDRNVVENVALAHSSGRLLTASGLMGKTTEEAAKICESVGLGDSLYRMPDELPHAGILRLELARALATDPDLLLIDEPFAGLTDLEVQRISDLLLEKREQGLTMIVVDHNMRGLLSLIDRAFVINFGSKIAEGTPEEIREDKGVQDAYLGGEL